MNHKMMHKKRRNVRGKGCVRDLNVSCSNVKLKEREAKKVVARLLEWGERHNGEIGAFGVVGLRW